MCPPDESPGHLDWRAVLEAGPWAYLLLTARDYTIMGVSDAYVRATRTKREDIIGRRLFDVFPDDPSDPSADGVRNLLASLDQVCASGETDVMAVQRYPIRRPGEEGGGFEERFWSPVNAPVLDADGQVVLIVHRVEDVTPVIKSGEAAAEVHASNVMLLRDTERLAVDIVLRGQELQRLNQQLRDSEARFRSMFDGAAAGMLIATPRGRIAGANRAFKAITGYRDDELQNRSLASLLHPAEVSEYEARVMRLIAGDESSFVGETRGIRKDGSMAWVRVSVSLTRRDDGRPLDLVVIVDDLSAQKNADERLRETERLLEAAGRVARFGGWLADLRNNRVIWSDQVCEIHELPHGTVVPIEQGIRFYAPEYRDTIRDAFDACVEQRVPYDLELEIETARGRRVWVRTIGEPIVDPSGHVIRVQGAFQDISASRRSEAEAKLASERLTRTLENLTVAFFTVDHEWRFTYLNRRAEQLLQRDRSLLLGRNLWAEFPEATGTTFHLEYQRAVRENQGVVFEEFYAPLGRWFEVHASTTPDGLAVQFRDVTERRAAAERMRELAALLDEARDAITVRDLAHRVTYWNRGAERMFGWTAEEILGQDFLTLLHPDPRMFQEAAIKVLADGEWTGELEKVTKDGRTLTVEARWTLVRDEAGHPRAVFGISTDVTERKKLEQQFLRAQRTESIGTLASGIAHDLNNLLQPIFSSVGLLKTLVRDDRALAGSGSIEEAAQRAGALVKQVVSFSKGVEGARNRVDAAEVVRELASITSNALPKNISMETHVAADLWPILGDATQLTQALLNLCVNARDAMPSGGKLVVSARNMGIDQHYALMQADLPAGRYVAFEVSDTGTGIPPAVADRMFEPFFTTKKQGEGSGIGLSTVAAIVKSHMGSISVHSEPGKGTVVRLCFPAAIAGTDASTSPPAEQPDARGSDGQGELILVVDDEPAIRSITQLTLEMHGYRALTAESGPEAVAIFASRGSEIAAVLTDMMMPIMDGLALATALRSLDPHVRIVVSSGLMSGVNLSKLSGHGVSGVLAKPYTAETLLQTIESVLQARRPGPGQSG